MEPRNRNLLLGLLGAALLLCCCCLLLVGALAGFITTRPSQSTGPIGPSEGPIIVVTRVVTPPAEPTGVPVSTPQVEATTGPTITTESGSPATVAPEATEVITGTPSALSTVEVQAEQVLLNAEMPQRDQRELKLRLEPKGTDIPVVVNSKPPSYKAGDTAKFWVSNTDTEEHRQITAQLRYVTDHVYIWVENGLQLNQGDLERSAERFEKQTYPTDRQFFGSEWTPGVDDDVHLTLLHARNLGEGIAGYYSSADEFSNLVNPYSNQREMFYIVGDSQDTQPNTSFYDGVLAHEFQHMIHWYNDRNEDTWVNEGMSDLAMYLNGFDVGGADMAYSQKPDTQLDAWADPKEGNIEHYGASFLFMTYFLDRFGEDLTKAVVASSKNGIAGFNDALAKAGRSERFNDIFTDWIIANYLNRRDADPSGRFGYKKLDPYPPAVSETYRRFPVSASAQVSQYGADYIRLQGRGSLTIDFTGQPQIGLVDTNPQDKHAWWSNRGDDSDATLTRAFDLSSLQSATLTFSAWYNVEDGYDYIYAEASADAGAHWQVLRGKYATDKDPVGNAYGPGWTGMSGGGDTPDWVQEKIDLTPFAGKKILLRFEYVTDDALNGPGFLLDSIAIPELKYKDDGEAGTAGWEPAGWMLTDNTLSEQWLVQVVEVGSDKTTVQRLNVGPDGKGSITVDNLGNLQEAMLVISALAPVTTEPAHYSYTISAR